jgi:transcriptional regulator with XRE-family HTH domain
LADIRIGEYIKKVAEETGWTVKSLARELQCNPSLISYYYSQRSLKIKPLISISIALHRNLLAEVYLCRMRIVPVSCELDGLSIIWNEPYIRIVQANNEANPLVYRRETNEKVRRTPHKSR